MNSGPVALGPPWHLGCKLGIMHSSCKPHHSMCTFCDRNSIPIKLSACSNTAPLCSYLARGKEGASMVRLQCLHWALAAPTPHDFHRPLSTLLTSSAFRSTDVFWPALPEWFGLRSLRLYWVRLGQAYILVRGHSFSGCNSASPTWPSHIWQLGKKGWGRWNGKMHLPPTQRTRW